MSLNKPLNIVAPTRYPWSFNGPRNCHEQGAHIVHRRNFIPFNKISPHIEGFTIINRLGIGKLNLVHAFNRIPIGWAPYIIGFESHLPRAFGLEKTLYYKLLVKSLASKRCRAIIAISKAAERQFLLQHKDSPYLEALKAKMMMRYPNIYIGDSHD